MNKPLRILFIDDNPDDRALAVRALSREFPDLQVKTIIDATGFAQAQEAGDFDLVITDDQLCWTDGLAVLNALKARDPDCPVIMFTGTGSEEVAVKAMKAGLNDYVIKSSKHFARLPIAVRSILEKVQQQRTLEAAESNYRSLCNNVPIGLYRTTPTGQIVDANPALVQILGYPDRKSLLQVNAANLYVEARDPQKRPSSRLKPVHAMHALVVDNEPSVRQMITAYLSADGHTVETATNGREGLERFHAGQFDVVVTARAMPEMNGDQLVAAIKQIAASKPVIMLTGFGDMMKFAADQLPEDVDLILSKPVTLMKFREALARVCQ